MMYQNSRTFAKALDQKDPLAAYRQKFHIPVHQSTEKPMIYFCGNSLGLQPTSARTEIDIILQSWAERGVEGHFEGQPSWIDYNTPLKKLMGEVVGASQEEVVIMNTLSVNLHLLLASFYRPSANRYKVLIETISM